MARVGTDGARHRATPAPIPTAAHLLERFVREAIGLKKNFTPRGMRRTFNDVARAAKVENLVTKSISGHLTDRMKDHYSTVSPVEQRESIGRVLRLVKTGSRGGAPSGAPT
jgi:hypothetical protein